MQYSMTSFFVMSECVSYKYGPNCGFDCGHCKYGKSCAAENGVCTEGCNSGWIGVLCVTGKFTTLNRIDRMVNKVHCLDIYFHTCMVIFESHN